MSKALPTLANIKVAGHCYFLMVDAGTPSNHAIRSLEAIVDAYGQYKFFGNISAHEVDRCKIWSNAAILFKKEFGHTDGLIVEHGTPRRALAKMVVELVRFGKLTQESLDELIRIRYVCAVLSPQENAKLNRKHRSQALESPLARWASCGITFPEGTQP